MVATHDVHSRQINGDGSRENRAQPVARATRRRVRVYYVLALAGMAALYLAGFYSHPLLLGRGTTASAEDCSVEMRTETSAGDESALGLELQDLPVAQAYQVLAQEVRGLGGRDYTASELEARLVALEQEVEQLRVLNPYYHFKEIQAEVIPSGVPEIYGAALNVSFDRVQASINVMRRFDPTYGEDGIVLTDTDLERYVRVGSATACLYCCDARTLVKPDGVAACGCAHSQAMRGLAAYLITNHPDDYTNEELVEELNRWRAVYFPKQTLTQALVERRDAGESGIEEIEQEFPEFMPQMVGGC